MIYEGVRGVPIFDCIEYFGKSAEYCLLIPIINEGERIKKQLGRAHDNGIHECCDIVICDGGSTDGSVRDDILKGFNVNTLLVKRDTGRQGAQLRMGIYWALARGYKGVVTIDGNNKDSIEDVPTFITKLEDGYDLVQGSRYMKGGKAVNTPLLRHVAVKLLHVPIINLTAGYSFTDTTNAYRAYSKKYLLHPEVQPLRDVFVNYELLAYLSVRAPQLGLKTCEVPVSRAYPKRGKTPTKISFFSGNFMLLKTLIFNLLGRYNPQESESDAK